MATRFFPSFSKNLVTSPFGTRVHPITGIKTMHNGIDMTATHDGKTGQVDAITAHTGGIVEKVGYDWSAGNFVNIRVDSRTVMVYYHMAQKCTLKKGAKVKKGDRLGYMGKTGSATGAHLHFGIKYDGKWIDPQPYLDSDWAQPVTMVSVPVPVLTKGATGESVRAMQLLLIGNACSCGQEGADGSFGPATEKALGAYQEKTDGLDVDYCCGPASWKRLLGS